MRSFFLLLPCLGLLLAGCFQQPCTLPSADGGCPPPKGACTDAGVGQACPLFSLTCGCCLAGSTHCDLLNCQVDGDGGLRWEEVQVVAPPECQ